MQLLSLNNQMVHQNLKFICQSERAITAEVLVYINEVFKRKIHLEMGYDSLLSYLINEMGYSKTAALRRMDAAKLLAEMPDLKKDFSDGTINLTQASLLAQGVRQKNAEQKRESQKPNDQIDFFELSDKPKANRPAKPGISIEKKKEILKQLKNQTLEDTQKTLAKELDLKVQAQEKKRIQKDESVRIEITLTEEQMKDLERAKELLSHVYPGGKISDIFSYAIKDLLGRKDPLRKAAKKRSSVSSEPISVNPENNANVVQSTVQPVSARSATDRDCQLEVNSRSATDQKQKSIRRISVVTKRAVFNKYQSCQWRDPVTGQICGSRFQLQVDHIQPVWAGGTDDPENLQVLCGAHNRFKYQQESGTCSYSGIRPQL